MGNAGSSQSLGQLIGAFVFAGVPLGVGDFVVRDAAYDFLSAVNDATVVGAIAESEADVLGPFVGLLIPLRTFLSRGDRRRRAGDQALV